MRKGFCACLLAFGLLSFAGQGGAADFNGQRGGFYGPGANAQNSEAAREIIQRNYSGMEETIAALQAKRNELDAILSSPNPDGARIESLSREIGELRGKVLAARTKIRSQLAQKGLSPDFLGSPDYDPDYRYGGPRGYHHGRHHHDGWGPRRGCMMGCW